MRFEADEFAAAFVAANKSKEGDIRLAANESSGDYNYTVTFKDNDLWIRVDSRRFHPREAFGRFLRRYAKEIP